MSSYKVLSSGEVLLLFADKRRDWFFSGEGELIRHPMTFSHKSVFKNPCQKATGSSGFLSMSSLFFLCGTLKINTYFTSNTCCQSLTFCAEGTQSLLGNTVALGNEELGTLVRKIVL